MTPRAFVLTLTAVLVPWTTFAQDTNEDPRLAEWVNELGSPAAEVRARAARELLLGGREGIRALLDAAAGSNVIVAVEARNALTSAGPDAIDLMEDVAYRKAFDHPKRLEEAFAAVARMGEPVLPRMLENLTTANPAGSRFAFAVGVLRRLDGLAVESMIRLLKHPKPKVRYEAAVLLAHWADPRALDGLLAALEDEESSVRAYAADGLGKMGDHRAIEPLLRALSDPMGEPRRAAAAALAKLYEQRVLYPIARLARADGDILVRETASNVLINYSQDPIGIRLGERYKPAALSPARQARIQLGFAFRFTLTGVMLVAASSWLSRRHATRGHPHWPSVLWVAVVAGGSGFVWGRVVVNVSSSVENLLLFVAVPSWAGLGLVGWKLLGADREARLLAWKAMGIACGCFYVGYATGWLALWGYFGL